MAPRLERIVFFGTPAFAVPALEALVTAGRAPILVVTQPAKPAGRGQALREPPVAEAARRLGLPVAQPARVREPDFLDRLRDLRPDLAVVLAFGQIFPPALLELPRAGCVNVHASLLPAWRGASPIAAAIAAGDPKTGVTTMRMEAGLDTGPMLLAAETPIGPRETTGDLAARLAVLGADLLLETIAGLEAGTVVPRAQDPRLATLAPKLRRDQAALDFDQPAERVAARIRALAPWPGAEAMLRGAPLKLWGAWALPAAAEEPAGSRPPAPGEIVDAAGRVDAGDALVIACAGGALLAASPVQRPGRRRLAGAEFARGERLRAGERLEPLAAASRPVAP